MFELLDKEIIGKTIVLGNKVRVSDPCYDMDTWCAGTLDNVLPGEYTCFTQRVDTGDWGIRIASIEVRHKDYQDVDATEVQDIDVGVDSGQCGIYDLDYFKKCKENAYKADVFYDKVCDLTDEYIKNPNYVPFNQSTFWKETFKIPELVYGTSENFLNELRQSLALLKAAYNLELNEEEKNYIEAKKQIRREIPWEDEKEYWDAKTKYNRSQEGQEKIFRFAANTLDNKCLVSSSGDGDGSYTCLVGRNTDGKIVSIKIDYYHGYDEDDDE